MRDHIRLTLVRLADFLLAIVDALFPAKANPSLPIYVPEGWHADPPVDEEDTQPVGGAGDNGHLGR